MTRNAPSHISPFEVIKRRNPDTEVEYWSSRDLAKVLGYEKYINFEVAIEKAKLACANSDQDVENHFAESTETVIVGHGAQREVKTVFLSRYACYLTIQNSDPRKLLVSEGQTYFAIQTRLQELQEAEIEEERRLQLRDEIRRHNAQLADAAKESGIVEPRDYAIFQNHGYRGLYGGLNMADIHRRKGLKKSQKILDHMGSAELAANFFRATQTEEKLRRDKIKGKDAANMTHFIVAKKVRAAIEDIGGTKPENLPVAESIKKLETKRKKLGKPPVKKLPPLERDGESDEA